MRSKFIIVLGALITAPLMAVLYVGHQVWNVPYPPQDLFDWVARVLPGNIITLGIEAMVSVIDKLNLGATDSTAKSIERLMATVQFFAGGLLVAGVVALLLYGAQKQRRSGPLFARWLGLAVLFALPLIIISWHMNYRSAEDVTNVASETSGIVWLVAIFGLWALALSRAFDRGLAINVESADTGTPIETMMLNRRQFLIQVGGITATITVVGSGLGYLWNIAGHEKLPPRKQDVDALLNSARASDRQQYDPDLEPAPGTRPEYTPLDDHYRIDINLSPPEIDESKWRLKITGMVDQELALTLDEIRTHYEPINQFVTLQCISNPLGGDLISTTLWTGSRLSDVLADAGIRAGATHLKITAADGFYETVDLEKVNSDDRVMLCYAWDGREKLLQKHGFPLRIYIPDLYGMKQPKWITEIEVMDHDEDGYWVERGWNKVAQMRTTSIIDVAATDHVTELDGVKVVPVGGIAIAGARQISKVEVKVDDGDWNAAQLRTPLSETTWVVWRYDWPFEEGDHKLAVRCYEGDGTLQMTEARGTKPSGAAGIFTKEVEV